MRLPAYGRDLIAIRQRGVNPSYVCISLNFELGRALPRLVVPVGVKVSDIDFRCVSGLDCLIAHEDETSRALDVAESALKAGARLATINDQTTGKTIVTDEVKAIRGMK